MTARIIDGKAIAAELRGKVADIHPGSQAARYWAGFGAGSAWVKINGELVDAKSNDVLLRFEQQRVGAMGHRHSPDETTLPRMFGR